MGRLVAIGLLTLVLVSSTLKILVPDQEAERIKFMEKCSTSYKEFECVVLWKYGNYPSKPFIDMTGSPAQQILETTAEPVRPPRSRQR